MKPCEGNYGGFVKVAGFSFFFMVQKSFHKCTQSVSKVFIHIEYL